MESMGYVALSAQVVLQKQLDTVANNVANSGTTGYKPDHSLFQSFVERLAVPGGSVSFVQDRATYVDRKEGEINLTGNPWDVAIKGDGFLAVSSGKDTLYTRDGHLQVGQDGNLISSTGLPVLGPDNAPIQIPPQRIDGTDQGGRRHHSAGKRCVPAGGANRNVSSQRPTGAPQSGGTLFSAPAGSMQSIPNGDRGSHIVQGGLEGSTVQPVAEIANLTELGRAYDRLQTLLSDDNDRQQKMIQTLGQSA